MPLYAIVAHDFADALPRRLETRERHVAGTETMRLADQLLFGAAMIEDGEPHGSILIANFPDRAGIDTWLATEPYVVGRVWERWSITEIGVGPAFVHALAGAPEG